MLSTMPDHDLFAVSIPVEMDSNRLRDVITSADLQMAEHLNGLALIHEFPLPSQGLVAHHRFGLVCSVIILAKDRAGFVIATAGHQRAPVIRNEPVQEIQHLPPIDKLARLVRAASGARENNASVAVQIPNQFDAFKR